tara:strand:+ start:1148 stop:1885 length:738 start_codon:yes stop_codon:yes gene_type:complete
MIEFDLIYFLLFILVVLQSIAGVGVLVIGTPMLLLFNFTLVEILSILLPISIITSLLNLILFKLNQKKLKINIDREIKFSFFLICLPFIFIGLYLLRSLENYINFKYLISFVIFSSLIINNQKKFLIKLNKKIKTIYLALIGIVHGLTNSGGSLLSLFLSFYLNKNQSRYNITYFYFFLALFQFLMFIYIFDLKITLHNLKFVLLAIPIGVILGNFLSKYTNDENFRFIISILGALTCFVLLLDY